MNRSPTFWSLMIVFQVVFGLAVFAGTRHYYLTAQEEAASRPGQGAWPHGAVPQGMAPNAWPPAEPGSSLENLMSTFPVDDAASSDPAVLLARADRSFGDQQYEQAAQLYERAIAAGAKDADTYNNLGITLHYVGRSAEALQRLQEGIAIDPGYQRIWLTLGYVSGQVGQVEQARAALNKAVEMGPDTDVGQSAAEMLQKLP